MSNQTNLGKAFFSPGFKRIRLFTTIILLLITQLAWPDDNKTPPMLSDNTRQTENGKNTPDQPLPLDIDPLISNDLLLFQEMPVVISASRQAQPISQSSIPVTVITREDIHYSGLNSIPEILQFYTAVDVLKMDNLRYGVGVRGMHGTLSDRTLVLLDGKPVYNIALSGVEWHRLPVLIDDIERIEIVRGPGGAAWGANAYTGVINIITIKPGDRQGWLFSESIDHWTNSYSHIRWSDQKDKWSWRQSIGYTDQKSSDATVENDNFISQDFNRQWMYDGRISYRPTEDTTLDFGLGYAFNNTGDYELMAYFPQEEHRHHTGSLSLGLTHTFSDSVTGQIGWSSYDMSSHIPNWIDHYCVYDNNLEGQLNIQHENHAITLGSNIRLAQIAFNRQEEIEVGFDDTRIHEQSIGSYVIDRWSITDHFVLEGQLRGDWYSGTEADWSGRMTGLYSLDEEKNHILRLSTAKAFRAPTVAFREATVGRVPLPAPFPAGLYGFNVVKAQDMNNEETWSIEAGYSAQLTRDWLFKLDGYYQRMTDLIGIRFLPDTMGLPVQRQILILDNIDGADTYGLETELAWTRKAGKLSAWYAYNDLVRDRGEDQVVRAFLPAKHKCGLTGRLFLPQNWTLNSSYRFSTFTPSDSIFSQNASESHRLDLTVARSFMEERAELMFGISNLLNSDNDPVLENGQLTGHETMGRAFFGRVQMRF